MKQNALTVRALAAFLTLAPIVAAQQEAKPGPARTETPTLNVKFPGGTLHELVELLRAQNDQVNIVAPELSARVPVPPMHLRAVSAEAALRAAATVIDKPFDLNVASIGQPNGGAVLALRVNERTTRSAAMPGTIEPDETRVEVFSLRAITKALPGEPDGIAHRTATVLTAIDTGLGFVRSATKPSLKLHEDSDLLFVSATVEQLQIVNSVLNRLEASVAAARAEARAAAGGPTKADAKQDPKKSPN